MLLASDLWVSALIRRAELSGAFGMVLRKGDARAGAVLVKVLNRPQGTAKLYAEATRLDSPAKAGATSAAVRGSARRKRMVTMIGPRSREGEPPLEGNLGQAAIGRRRRHALVCNRIPAQEKSRF